MHYSFINKMRKQFILGWTIVLLTIYLTSVVSAEVWFVKEPEQLYSLGDTLEFSFSVSEAEEQLEVELSCPDLEKMLFVKYLINETAVEISQPLTSSFLGEMKGECSILAKYGGEEIKSQDFRIADLVLLNTNSDKREYYPKEEVEISGKAEKANSQLLDGFFELNFEELNLTLIGPVEEGKFKTNITLPETLAAGTYILNILAYQKAEEEITNVGKTKIGVIVKQKPTKIDFALNSQSVKPGNPLEFKILLYDQSEALIKGDASFIIEPLENIPIKQALTKINQGEAFLIDKNLSSGYYKIKAYSSGIYGERQFFVEENEEAEFKFENSTLIIKNIGNVRYNKAIQVKINDGVEIINTELKVGEEKKYELMAPDGAYSIVITDGATSLSNEGLLLTGNVISVKEIQRNFLAKNKILVWAFIILVLGMFVFVTSRRVLKRRFVLSDAPEKIEQGKRIIKMDKGQGGITLVKEPSEAEHTLVLKGHKQDTAIICLKIKNELSRDARTNLDQILRGIRDAQTIKAVNYKSNNYIMSILSPLVTKTFKNQVPAAKAALELESKLKEYNAKFKDKIEFGISVHSGEVVSRIENNTLKFTSLGSTLLIAKKIADLANEEVLLSRAIHEKTLNDIKTEKTERGSLEVFTISRMVNNERNEKFIQDFLKRQGIK